MRSKHRLAALLIAVAVFGLPLAWAATTYIWRYPFDMTGNRIMNVGAPVDPGDAVTKAYVGTIAAPATSSYVMKVPSASLPNAQALSTLPVGMLKNAGTAGFEQAYAGTDYCAPVAGVCGGGSLTGSGTAGSLVKWIGTSTLSIAYAGTDYCAPVGGSCGGAQSDAATTAAEIAAAIGASRWNYRVYNANNGTLDGLYFQVVGGAATLAYPSVAGGAISVYTGTNGTGYLYSGSASGQRQPFLWAAQVDDITKRVGYQCRARLSAGAATGTHQAFVGSRAGTVPGGTRISIGLSSSISTTKWALFVANQAGTSSSAVSTIDVDTNWHNYRGFVDSATTWKFSVDSESAVALGTPIWIDADNGPWWGGIATTSDLHWDVAWCVYVWAEI